jgi:hypothetical protein
VKLLAVAAMTKPIRANGPCGCTLTVGDPVVVDGLQGRGVIVARKGRNLVIRFRDGEFLKRDQRYVHKITSDYVSRYSSVRESNMVLNGAKVIRLSPSEFKKEERRAGIKPYSDAEGLSKKVLNAGEVDVEMEGKPLKKPRDAYIVRQGTLFCVRSRNQQDQSFGCFGSREEAEMHLGWVS